VLRIFSLPKPPPSRKCVFTTWRACLIDAATTLPVTDRFSQIINDLWAIVWSRVGAGATATTLVVMVLGYIRRTERRFHALVAKIEAGTLRPPRPRTTPRAVPSPNAAPDAAKRPHNLFPRTYGWLCALIPYQAAAAGWALNLMLDDPAVRPMIEAEPGRFGRLLRPLCRMVGADPLCLRQPKRQRRKKEKPPPPPEASPPDAEAARVEEKKRPANWDALGRPPNPGMSLRALTRAGRILAKRERNFSKA
jgi:hypothetical protein